MVLRSKSIFVALLTTVILVASFFFISPAHAATPAMARVLKNDTHCVEQINPMRPGQTASDIQSFKCYTTLSASLAAATGGRIHFPRNASGQDVSRALQGSHQTSATISPNDSNVVIIFFVDANFGGSSLTVSTTGPSCSTGATYGQTSMPSGWNDVVSSLQGGFFGCTWERLWVDINFSGASQCYNGSTSNVGSTMNDRTSSWYVRTFNVCNG